MLGVLPTYETIAEVLSNERGAGLRLAGCTVGRAALITPGICAVGVPFKQAALGSIAASSLISVLALMRFSYVAKESVPMKTVFWLGLLGASAVVIYYATKKDEPAPAPVNPADQLIDPYVDQSVSPSVPADPFASPATRSPMTGLNGLRAVRAPRFRGAY